MKWFTKLGKKWEGGTLGVANFRSYVLKNESDSTLILEYNFPFKSELNHDENSALARPFRRFLLEGSMPGTIAYTFHNDQENFYVLGTFVYTPKGRILFFPGLVDRKLVVYLGKKYENNKNMLDHFTLDKNLRTWHMTLENKTKKDYLKTFTTKKADSNNFLWCVLRIRELNALQTAPKTQIIEFHSKLIKKLNKISSIINKSREKAIFPIVKVDDDVKEQFFWQFEIFVSLSNRNRKDYPTVPVTTLKSSSDTEIKDKRKSAPSRSHQIFLEGFSGSLWIRVTKIIGVLPSPATFFSGESVAYEK